MHIPFNTELAKFLESNVSNMWIYHDNISIYVRKGHHTLPPLRAIQKTFDVANVNVPDALQAKGIFTDWLCEAEELASGYGLDAVFVESVLNPRLASFLIKRGYTKSGPDNCPNFFRYCQ